MAHTTWCKGSSFTQNFLASSTPSYVLHGTFTQPTPNPFKIDYILNGTQHNGIVSSDGSLTVTGINPGATNTLQVFFGDNDGFFTEWTITGCTMDIGSVPRAASAPGPAIIWYGTSITEGIGNAVPVTYAYLVTQAVGGYAFANQSASGSDLTLPGEAGWSGGIYPVTGTPRWNHIDSGISMLDSAGKLSAYGATGTTPNVIVVDTGANAAIHGVPAGVEQTQMAAFLPALRNADLLDPDTTIIVIIPFGLYSTSQFPTGPTVINEIKAAIATANQTASNKINTIDLGANTSAYLLANGLTMDNIHLNQAGHSYIAGLLTPLFKNILQPAVQPPPVDNGGSGSGGQSTVGLPYYGFGTPLHYANAGATSVANGFAWMAQQFCVGRSMLTYTGWGSGGAYFGDTKALANSWGKDPTLNGTNTGKQCIPLAGNAGTTADGALTFANVANGSQDANLKGLVDAWCASPNNWKVVIWRWGYEDMYPTTNSGVNASPGYNNSYPSGPNNTYTPWAAGGKTQAGYVGPYIKWFRHASVVMHAQAATHNSKWLMCWGPCFQNGTDFDTRNIYPDSDLTDGHGKLVDTQGPDCYYNNCYGQACQNTHPNYDQQSRYTQFTGTTGVGTPGTRAWNLDVGTRIYYMDWICGNKPAANPTQRIGWTGGYGTYDFFTWALQNHDPIGMPEYGGAYGAGQGNYWAAPPSNLTGDALLFHGPPGSVNGQDNQGNWPTVLNPANSWTTDFPWGGAWLRQVLNWVQTPGTIGVGGQHGANGIGTTQIAHITFWEDQSHTTLLGHKNAFPEMVANPDAGQTGGGGVTNFLFISAIPNLAVGQQATITVSFGGYSTIPGNLSFDATGTGTFSPLPAGAAAAGSGTITFPYTPTATGNFTMTVKDSSNGITALAQPYTVATPQPQGISILIPAIPDIQAGTPFSVQIAFNGYRPNQANLLFGHNVGGVGYTASIAAANGVFSANGQILTIPLTDNLVQQHFTAIEDTSFAPPLLSNISYNNVVTSGGFTGGTVTVTPPGGVSTTPSISLSAPGTRTEASLGAGVDVLTTATTLNITSGNVYWKVVQNGGAGPDETSYVAAPINASTGVATFTAHMAHSNDIIRAVDNISAAMTQHGWTLANGLNSSQYTLSGPNNTTAHIPQNSNPNVWTTIWASAALPPGTKIYWEVTVTGMKTGTASGLGAGSVADGFQTGNTTQLNNPSYQCSAGYNGSFANSVNGASTTIINPRQWPNNTQPPGWQATPASGLEAFTYTDSSGNVHEGYATINTSYQQANGNTSAFVPWGGPNGAATVVGFLCDQINMQFATQTQVVATGFKQTGLIGPFPITFSKTLTPVTGCQTAFLPTGGLTAVMNGGSNPFVLGLPAGYTAYDGGAVTATTYDSSPVTIVETGSATPTMTISSPGTVAKVAGATGVLVHSSITTTNVTGSIYWGVVNQGNTLYAPLVAVTVAASGTTVVDATLFNTGDKVVAQNTTTAPTLQAYSSAVTITTNVSNPSLTITNPGQITLPPGTSSINWPFSVNATNLSGTLNWIVKSSAGVQRSSGTATIAADGTATFNAPLQASGDTVTVSSAATPSVQATTLPVLLVTQSTTSQAQTISVSSPGTVTEATLNAGVTPNFTVTTTNITGGISYRVRQSNRAVETSYVTVLPQGAAITVPTSIPDQAANKSFSVQTAFNYIPNPANIRLTRNVTTGGPIWALLTPDNGANTVVWSNGGQLLTITTLNGVSVPHQWGIQDITPSAGPLTSPLIPFNIVASGGGGTVSVPAPTPIGAGQLETWAFSQLMLHDQDVLQLTPASPPPSVTGLAAVAWITWTGTGPYVYSVHLLNISSDTPLGSFWYAWQNVPDIDLLPSAPTPGADPTGWSHSVQGSGSNYSIQYTASTPLAVGAQVAFTYTSADTPNTLFGFSGQYPITTSFAYSGGIESGASTTFVATDNSLPGVTANSSPVHIVEVGSIVKSIQVSAPGTVDATTPGGGVTVPLTVQTQNITGQISWEVITSTGAVETGYTAVTVPSGSTVALTDTFTRANTTPGAAGSTTGAGNGWIDQFGNGWNINANTLIGTANTHNIQLYLARPVGEAALNTRIAATFTFATTGMAEVAVGLRQQTNPAQSYIGRCVTSSGFANNEIDIFSFIGSGTQITTGAANTLVAGQQYTLDFQASGANPTNLTLTLFDSTGAQLATQTVQDSTPQLQSAGVPYLLVWAAGGTTQAATWNKVVTYTGANSTLTINPTFLNSGDMVQLTDNPASPGITVRSSPVTINQPAVGNNPTVTAMLLGVTPAANGIGFTAALNIAVVNFSSSQVFVQVQTPTGNVETPYYAVPLGLTAGGATYSGSANVNVPFMNSGDNITVVDQVNPQPNTVFNTGPITYSAPVAATITVVQPSTLYATTELITAIIGPTGTPPISAYFYWASGPGAANPDDATAIAATIDLTQNPPVIYAAVPITGAGIPGTLYLDTTGANVWQAVFTATPVSISGAVTATVDSIPQPFLPGPQVLTGTITDNSATLLVCLRLASSPAPIAINPDVVQATIQNNQWAAQVVAGGAGLPATIWLSIDGAAFYNAGTVTPVAIITVDQPVGPFYNTVPYTVIVDFDYILAIPTGGPIPSTVNYTQTGAAPFTPIGLTPNGTQVTRNAQGNTRLIMGMQDPTPVAVTLFVQDTAPPGGGPTVVSNTVQYTVVQRPTATGSPFIFAYNPTLQTAHQPWTGQADFTYLVTSLASISVQYNGTGYLPAATLPLGATIKNNPTVPGASRIVFTLNNANPGNFTFQVQDSAPPGGGGAIQSQSQPFAVVAAAPPQTVATETYRMVWSDGSQFDQVKKLGTTIVSQGFIGSNAPTTASQITMWTPPQATINRAVTWSFVFVGQPMGFDYTTNAGSTWTTVPIGNQGINNATLTGTITIPAGFSTAQVYAKGQLGIRDTNNHAAVSFSPGQWVVSAFNPASVSAFTPIFAAQIANPNLTILDANGHVARTNDFFGSPKFLSAGPTTPPNNPAGSTFSGTNPISLLRLAGLDSGQAGLGMTPTTNSGAFDNFSNYLGAGTIGQNGGVNDALIAMWNQIDLSVNNGLICYGVRFDSSLVYEGGPIWGWYPDAATGAYLTAGRYHSGQFNAQVNNTSSGYFFQTAPTLVPASGYHVITLQQIGTLLQTRIDGGPWSTVTLPPGQQFAATTFSYGGSIIQGIGQVNSGNSYPELYDLICGQGIPSPIDITQFETWVWHSFGHT
jgi:hypothetical protein